MIALINAEFGKEAPISIQRCKIKVTGFFPVTFVDHEVISVLAVEVTWFRFLTFVRAIMFATNTMLEKPPQLFPMR